MPEASKSRPVRPPVRPTPTSDFDVAVVGAGVAGSICAALLSRSGFRVLLLDKAIFPRAKICGEGLMPAGRQLLEELGLGADLTRAGARSFSALRFHLPRGKVLELDFSESAGEARGCVLTRESLDHLLVRFAARQPGVEWREGCRVGRVGFERRYVELEVEGLDPAAVIRARAVVAADGIRSRFRRPAGIRALSPASNRCALRRLQSDFASSAGAVDVYCTQEAEAYVAPLPGGKARVTLLADKRSLPRSRGPGHVFERLLTRFPEVVKQIGPEAEAGPVEATSPVSARFSHCHSDRLLLVGDAAGAVDPVTGQGMTVAIRDAHLAARVLSRALADDRLGQEELSCYSSERERYFLPSWQLARQLLTSLRYPWLADRARLALIRCVPLRQKVLALAADPGPETRLSRVDHLRLVAGF